MVYNPTTKQYYKPDNYKFDPSRLPCNKFPSQIYYNGALHADLYRHSHKNTPEQYPSGMILKLSRKDDDPADYTTAIVSSIPIRNSAGNAVPNQYILQHHNGSTFTKKLSKRDKVADSPINKTRSVPTPSLPLSDSLPIWLQHGCKITYNHDGEYHKGFIMISDDGATHFSCQRQKSSRTELWGMALLNLVTEWPSLTCDNIIQSTWDVLLFLRPSTAARISALFISVSHVSAHNLKAPYPLSLLKALHEDFLDCSIWHDSYPEEKNGLIDNDTYMVIFLQEYWQKASTRPFPPCAS